MAIQFKTTKPGLDLSHQILKGDDGGYYIPSVDANGNLTWTKTDIEMPDVAASNITGPSGADGAPGQTGPSGVYVGNEEPTDPSVLVWLIPDGQTSDYVMTETEVKSYIDESLEEVENGSY